MQVESQKRATKTGDRGQEERQQGTGPWLALYKASRTCGRGVDNARRARKCTEGTQGPEFPRVKAKGAAWRVGKRNSNSAYYISPNYITIKKPSLNILTSLAWHRYAMLWTNVNSEYKTKC